MDKSDLLIIVLVVCVLSAIMIPILSYRPTYTTTTPVTTQISTFHHELNGTWYDSEESYRAELRKHADEERARELQNKIQNTPAEDLISKNITVFPVPTDFIVQFDGHNYRLCPVTEP